MALVPVPRGMCPAFYAIMGAGGIRSDSGEIMMLKEPVQHGRETADATSTKPPRAARESTDQPAAPADRDNA